jgi:putative endonuclease
MNKYYVYVIQSFLDRSLFVGYTTDLKKRLEKHTNGYVAATKSKAPWNLIYCEYYTDKNDAKAREKFMKSQVGQAELQLMLKNTLMKEGT